VVVARLCGRFTRPHFPRNSSKESDMPINDLIPWRNRSRQALSDPARDPFASFRREMDRLFDDFWSDRRLPSPLGQFGQFGANWPSLDFEETENEYRVTAELPGLEEKDVNLELRDNALIISGEKRSQTEEGDKSRRVSERFYGRVERVIPYDTETDPDKVAATFKSGVLMVTIPKNQNARSKGRRIQISKTQ